MTLGLLRYTPIVEWHLGPLSISPHGLGTAIGFLAGARMLLVTTRRLGVSDQLVYAALTRGAIGAVAGARLAYVVNHLGSFDSPLEWIQIWNGGISLLGGIAGGLALGLPVMRRSGVPLWPVLDGVAPGLALGIAIGRVGDLVVADHLGKPTHFALGYVCPAADTASPCAAPVGQAVHQPALYDLVAVSVLLVVLLVLRRHRRRYDGFLALVFGAAYGAARFTEDFFRVDETHGTGLTGSQWTALTVATLSAWWLLARRRTPGTKLETPERVAVGSERGAAP
ncbi:MAG: prolipoprotein diacylglyceryl transferase [Acidimicrobiales bacterium]